MVELYTPYMARGGWKSVAIEHFENNGTIRVVHKIDYDTPKIVTQYATGKYRFDGSFSEYDLIERWKEPATVTVTCYMLREYYSGEYYSGNIKTVTSADGDIDRILRSPDYCYHYHIVGKKEVTITEGDGI